MDAYNVQFIIIAILLILVSIYNISKIPTSNYPGTVVDFLFHGGLTFIGLFLFYYFFVANLIKQDSNNGVSYAIEGVAGIIRETGLGDLYNEDVPPEVRVEIQEIVADKYSTSETDPTPEVKYINDAIFYRGLIACSIFFLLCIISIFLAKYFNYPIEFRHIIYFNIFLVIVTLVCDGIVIGVVNILNLIPLSDDEIAIAVYDRLKYNLNN